MSDPTPPASREARLKQITRLVLLGWAGLLLYEVTIIKYVGHGWRTGLFIWALAIGIAMAVDHLVTKVLVARFSRRHHIASRPGVPNWVSVGSNLVIASTVGVVAARSNWVWIDLAFTVVAGIGVMGGLISLAVLSRRKSAMP